MNDHRWANVAFVVVLLLGAAPRSARAAINAKGCDTGATGTSCGAHYDSSGKGDGHNCGLSRTGACVPDACGGLETDLFAADTDSNHWPYFMGCTPEFTDDGTCHMVMHGVSDGSLASTGTGDCQKEFPGCGIHFSPGVGDLSDWTKGAFWAALANWADDLVAACGGAMAPGLAIKGVGNSDRFAAVIKKHQAEISLFEYHSWGTEFGYAEGLPTNNRYNGGLCMPDGTCIVNDSDPVPVGIYACWAIGESFLGGILHAGFPTPQLPVKVPVPNLDHHNLERYLNCHDAPDGKCATPGEYSCTEGFSPTPVGDWQVEMNPDLTCPEFLMCSTMTGGPCSQPTCTYTGDMSSGACCFSNADCDSGMCDFCPGPGGVNVFGYCL